MTAKNISKSDSMSTHRPPAVPGRNIGDTPALPDAYKATWGVDVLLSGDLIRSSDILPGDPTDDCTVFPDDLTGAEDQGQAQPGDEAVLGEDRRGFGRYRLASNFIRVRIQGDDAKPSLGRMTNASVTGLFVRCHSPIPFRTPVWVEWCIMNDMKLGFMGRVIRSTDRGMAIHLTTDDANWRFRASFIDLCRMPSDNPPTVTVRKLTAAEARRFTEDDGLLKRLGEHWQRVEKDLADDARHQEFINTCLREQRLQFALERYRELQIWPAPNFDPTPYLQQIGTILTFYQLSRNGQTAEPGLLRRSFPMVVATVLVVIVLLAIPYFIGTNVTPPE